MFIQKLDANGNFIWVKQISGVYETYGFSIVTDVNQNVLITGVFAETTDFDPGPGIVNLVSEGHFDIFVLKLDSDGNFIWVKQMGGSDNEYAYSIALDDKGSIYTVGFFKGTADFDPGAETASLTSAGDADIFIQKLDASGNFLWVKQMGGLEADYGMSITTDINRNVLVTGNFEGTADFDPGAGTAELTSAGDDDSFILKLDTNGNFLWVKQIGGKGEDRGQSITTDAYGNVFSTGHFFLTVDFDPGAETYELKAAGLTDIYIQKLDAKGNFLWARRMGGTYEDVGFSIATDADGNIISTGYFWLTADFNPGAGSTVLTSAGRFDIYIQKHDTNGNLLWVKQMGGIGDDQSYCITTDVNGNIYTTGTFNGTVDFDPGAGTHNLTSAGGFDIFIQKLNSTTVGVTENYVPEKLVAYPNPTNGNLSVEFETIHKSIIVRILSITGQMVMNKQFQNKKMIQLELNQPDGIYILETIDERGNKTAVKLIKQ